jgi:hypothetical protein
MMIIIINDLFTAAMGFLIRCSLEVKAKSNNCCFLFFVSTQSRSLITASLFHRNLSRPSKH